MRRFPFFASRYALALLLGVNFGLLGISIVSGSQVRQPDEGDRQGRLQPAAVGAGQIYRQPAGAGYQLPQTGAEHPQLLSFHPIPGAAVLGQPHAGHPGLRPGRRGGGNPAYQPGRRPGLPDGQPGGGSDHHRLLQGRPVPGVGRQTGTQGPGPGDAGVHRDSPLRRPAHHRHGRAHL